MSDNDEAVQEFRESAHFWAAQAQAATRNNSDSLDIAAYAAMATMFLAFAADADRFGELPEIDETKVGRSGR